MQKFALAIRDFKQAAKVAPKDPDLRRKLAECQREVKRIKFEEALAAPVRSPAFATILPTSSKHWRL